MREGLAYGFKPGRDAGLACVYFLTTSDEADDHGPLTVTIEVGDQEFRLRFTKVRNLLSSLHEIGGLLPVPGALCLVENNDMIVGGGGVAYSLIAEVVNVLNEWLYLLPDGTFPRSGPLTSHFVSSKRLLQDRNQRTIP